MRTKSILVMVLCASLSACMSSQKRLERRQQNDPRYQYNLGLFHLNNNQLEEAVNRLKRAVSLNPRYALAYNALGQAHWMMGKIEESVQFFLKCLELDPTLTEAHNNLGVSYQEMGLLDKAEFHFQQAVRDTAYKSRELSYYNLARLYYIKNQFQESLFYIEKSLDVNRTFVMALNLKGILLERQNDFAGAIECYRKGLANAPDDLNIKFNLAVAYFKNNEIENAEELFRKINPLINDPETKIKIEEYLVLISKSKK